VYGREAGTFDESLPARPVSDYGISKAAGEGQCFRAAHAGDLEVFVPRFANGFGVPLALSASCWMLAFPSFCRSVVQTGRIVLKSPGMQQRAFVPFPDMLDAIELLLGTPALPAGDTDIAFNVGGGRSMSMRDAAHLVAEQYEALTGRAAAIDLPAGAEDAPAQAAVDYRFDRIAALGYRPSHDLADEVRGTLEMLLDAQDQR